MAEGVVFHIERLSLQDGPGIRTVVFLKGCPMRCRWCATPEGQALEPQAAQDGRIYGEHMTDEEVWKVVAQDIIFYQESGGGLTLSGGEPLVQEDFAHALLARAVEADVHSAVETGGAVPWSSIERLRPLTGLWLYDVKHYAADAHRWGTGEDNERVLKNLSGLVRAGAAVVARVPVIPGFNDSLDDARAFAELFDGLGIRRVTLMPFHQAGEKKYRALGFPNPMRGHSPVRVGALDAYRSAFSARGIDARV